jgi:hypothetical protein
MRGNTKEDANIGVGKVGLVEKKSCTEYMTILVLTPFLFSCR